MKQYISYWQAYKSESEAKNEKKIRWSDQALDNKIVLAALHGIFHSLTNSDLTDGRIEYFDNYAAKVTGFLKFNKIRFSLFAIQTVETNIPKVFFDELKDRSRESLCICILPNLVILQK